MYNLIANLRKILEDDSSGTELPAAIVLETVQAEGGINVAGEEWLRSLRQICDDLDILMIADEIQIGNGRTGEFFSFERAGVVPDIVTLSKSIGAGHPMALVLLKPELDKWSPGEHSGTFRGNNLAFVAQTAALKKYWSDSSFIDELQNKSKLVQKRMENLALTYPNLIREIRGHGMIWGAEFKKPELTSLICTQSFEDGLIIETAGAEGEVIKFLGPLVITDEIINEGFDILERAIDKIIKQDNK